MTFYAAQNWTVTHASGIVTILFHGAGIKHNKNKQSAFHVSEIVGMEITEPTLWLNGLIRLATNKEYFKLRFSSRDHTSANKLYFHLCTIAPHAVGVKPTGPGH